MGTALDGNGERRVGRFIATNWQWLIMAVVAVCGWFVGINQRAFADNEQHTRFFTTLNDHESRLRVLEQYHMETRADVKAIRAIVEIIESKVMK